MPFAAAFYNILPHKCGLQADFLSEAAIYAPFSRGCAKIWVLIFAKLYCIIKLRAALC